MLTIDWTSLEAAVVAFLLALSIQLLAQALIRTPSTGIIFAIAITNALLAAILAAVIFHS
jgi:hypothetical protein